LQAIESSAPVTVGTHTENITVTMGEENAFHNLMDIVHLSLRKAKYSISIILIVSMLISAYSFRYIIFHF